MPEIPTIASKPLPMRAVANLLEISHSQWYEIVQPRCSFAIVDQRSADPSVAPVPAFTLKHKSCFSLGDMLDGNVTIFAEDKPLKSARIPLDYAMGLVRCSRALPLREQKFKGKTH